MNTEPEPDQQHAPTDPGYYAGRGVTSESEQQMRAAYTRTIRGAAERPASTAPDCDLGMREERQYLADSVDAYRRYPIEMQRLHMQTLDALIDGVDMGMTAVQWRSRRQARELTGHGPWSPPLDPLSAEAARLRPYLLGDPGHPSRYTAAPTQLERVMRADFGHLHRLRWERGRLTAATEDRTDTEYQRITTLMFVIAEPWLTRDDVLGREWRDLRTLTAGHYDTSDDFADAVERIQHQHPRDEAMFARTVRQIRDLERIPEPSPSSDANRSSAPFLFSSASAAARTAELARRNRSTR
ncbi:hypothetical protein [Nocardia sp. NPDC051750]|uniref:hypothetical protein n=1 Tax=Nocardia sp. NPDC051750 TaxID=3364325 RepID=UPI00378D8F4E